MAICGTTVEYNGITMHGVVTREWNQEVVYEDSGADMLRHTFHLTFEGMVHTQNIGGEPTSRVDPTKASAVTTQAYVRAMLLQPRQGLVVKMGGETILTAHPATTSLNDKYMDVNNGPKPQSLDIIHVVSGNIFRVSFSIECSLLECGPKATGVADVLSNKWSVAETIDKDFIVSRIIQGRLQVSNAKRNLHIYRGLMVPRLENGFRRESFIFSASADGLTVDYEVTDRQVHTAAPDPATSISGRHTESTTDGIKMYTDMSVRLEGPPGANTQALITAAVNVIEGRIRYGEEKRSTQYPSYLLNGAVTEIFGARNIVEVHIKLLRNVSADDSGSIGSGDQLLRRHFTGLLHSQGRPITVAMDPTYNPAKSPPMPMYGMTPGGQKRGPAVVTILECYLQQPCLDVHRIAHGDRSLSTSASEGDSQGRYNTPVFQVPEEPPTERPPYLKTDIVKTPIYTKYKMESRYTNASIQVQLPIAKSSYSQQDKEPTSTVFSLAAPIYRRVINVEAERVGGWPQMPEAKQTYSDGDLNGTLLDHSLVMVTPTVAPDAQKRIYRILGEYIYAMDRPPTPDELINAGTLPMLIPRLDDKVSRETLENGSIGP